MLKWDVIGATTANLIILEPTNEGKGTVPFVVWRRFVPTSTSSISWVIKHITEVLILLRCLAAWSQTYLNWPFIQLFPLCIPTHCFPHRQIPEIQSRFRRDAFCPSLWALWPDCFGGGENVLSKCANLEVRMGQCLVNAFDPFLSKRRDVFFLFPPQIASCMYCWRTVIRH